MTRKTKPFLSIIIPNYNEKANIERGVLHEIDSFLKQAKFSYEVIISDDEATDGSCEMIAEFIKNKPNFSLIKNKHGGKALAIYAGVKKARGKIVLFTDMDQSTPLKEVNKLLPFYDQGYDVVFGSRGHSRVNAPWYRQIMSAVFLATRRLIILPQVKDTQCGFKSMRTKLAQKLFPQLEVIKNFSSHTSGWIVSAYDVELLFLAQKQGYKLKEVKVDWKDEDTSTSKGKQFINESIDMFKQILRVRQRDIKGDYDKT